MARFWPKSRYNGRVMAREIFSYQYLWITKFCAKFRCSLIPRAASMRNSFIVQTSKLPFLPQVLQYSSPYQFCLQNDSENITDWVLIIDLQKESNCFSKRI